MSKLLNVSIQQSSNFRGAFEVHATFEVPTNVNGWLRTHQEGGPVTRTEVIPCANKRTAVHVSERLRQTRHAVGTPSPDDLETICGCNTGGLGNTPAVTWLLTGRVERVHNWATARALKESHPPREVLASAVF